MDFDTRRLEPWEKIIPSFKYSADIPYFDLLVPTVDTVRYGFMMEKLLAINRSVMFTGTTGVGKVRRQSVTLLPFGLFVCFSFCWFAESLTCVVNETFLPIIDSVNQCIHSVSQLLFQQSTFTLYLSLCGPVSQLVINLVLIVKPLSQSLLIFVKLQC